MVLLVVGQLASREERIAACASGIASTANACASHARPSARWPRPYQKWRRPPPAAQLRVRGRQSRNAGRHAQVVKVARQRVELHGRQGARLAPSLRPTAGNRQRVLVGLSVFFSCQPVVGIVTDRRVEGVAQRRSWPMAGCTRLLSTSALRSSAVWPRKATTSGSKPPQRASASATVCCCAGQEQIAAVDGIGQRLMAHRQVAWAVASMSSRRSRSGPAVPRRVDSPRAPRTAR